MRRLSRLSSNQPLKLAMPLRIDQAVDARCGGDSKTGRVVLTTR
jgi:hypothetical protein